jgi:hypothetical protein
MANTKKTISADASNPLGTPINLWDLVEFADGRA